MKACIIQPFYSMDYERSDELLQWELDQLDKCDPSMDLIVLPESSDVPAFAKVKADYYASTEKYTDKLLAKCKETAIRCDAVVFVNASYVTPTGPRNTTYAINRQGEEVGYYFKKHLVPSEITKTQLDHQYTFEHDEPTVITIDGIRYGFLTCYDFYFYEAYPNIARQNVDIIIGCSHQRSDTLQAIELINRFLAYHTNAYVIRSSVCMEVDGNIGGGSQIVSPYGNVLADMANKVGMACAEFDPHDKYYKPAGFGNPPAAHYEYIDLGRRPWHYRPGGSAIARPDCWMNYPRVCAHRGFTPAGPENSLTALGAAIALGTQEIEFDVWSTTDGEFVAIHDEELSRLSNGTGKVWEKSYAELLKLDFGTKAGPGFEGMKVVTLEEILKKYSCHAIMNIHLKTPDGSLEAYDEKQLQKLIDLIYKYDCTKHVYIMTGNDTVLKQLKGMAPWLQLCCGGGMEPWRIVDRAIAIGCDKVQLFKPYFNQEMIDKAHENGLKCNVFWSDDPEEARSFLEMGIDTILTNQYRLIAPVVESCRK